MFAFLHTPPVLRTTSPNLGEEFAYYTLVLYSAEKQQNSPSKLEGVPEGWGRVSATATETNATVTHTPPVKCWVEWQCLRHRTLSFAQNVLCHLPERYAVRTTSPNLGEEFARRIYNLTTFRYNVPRFGTRKQ